MSEKKQLILFDVDGTLAESSKVVNDAILIQLSFMKDNIYEFGLISGGSYEKIINQVGIHYINPERGPLFKYVFCENGMIGYQNNEKFFEKKLVELYSENEIKEIENFITSNTIDFVEINKINKLEKRNSMWYFSPSGVHCDDITRKKFIEKDKKENIRIKIIKLLKSTLEEKFNLTIKLGGNIGLAIHPIGWDKSYIIENNILDTSKYQRIYFFGDKCTPEGNDYPLYNHPKINGIAVKDPDDTIIKLSDFFLSKF